MKLWQKKFGLDSKIEKFTVGRDYLVDRTLLPFDVAASKAHAKMLHKIKILSSKEYAALARELDQLLVLFNKGKITVSLSDEDCHTAIENYLTAKLGDSGKKIHTGRSRNDQSLAAIRLYTRAQIDSAIAEIKSLQAELKRVIKKYGAIAIPGYTHMQKAMPSSISLWLGAFEESLADDLRLLLTVRSISNQSPLGSAAGYGTPIPVDRKLASKLLSFEKVQNNTLYVQNARGKFELMALHAVQQVMLDLNKLANDLLLFSTVEFGFVSLPKEMTTGSSIMPQKRNPDVLELVRARYGQYLGYVTQVQMITANLPSGYNRDFQLTKESLVLGLESALETIQIMTHVVSGLKINEERCKKAMTPELFATHKAYELVKKGMPFRTAYKKVADEMEKENKRK